MQTTSLGDLNRRIYLPFAALGVLFSSLLGGCGGGSGSVPVTVPAKDRIVFQSVRGGPPRLFIMNGDGTGQTPLTTNVGLERSPTFSEDGTRIAFSYSPSGAPRDAEIVTVRADGSGFQKLTNNAIDDDSPSFSPDGKKIAYKSTSGINSDIIVLNTVNGQQVNLTGTQAFALDPHFDPQGRVLFSWNPRTATNPGSQFQIYRIKADGTGLEQLTSEPFNHYYPAPSPDGQTIVFVSDRSGSFDLYSIAAKVVGPANQPQPLLNDGGNNTDPAFTPDGKRIVFSSSRDGDQEIFRINADGSGLIQLTNNKTTDRLPATR